MERIHNFYADINERVFVIKVKFKKGRKIQIFENNTSFKKIRVKSNRQFFVISTLRKIKFPRQPNTSKVL